MNEILQINLPELGEHQMRPFQSLCLDGDLYCGSRDGRLFVVDPGNYQIKNTINLHNSWISSVQSTPQYIVTCSYDGSVAAIPKENLQNLQESNIIQRYLHNDYILSMCINDHTLYTASSEAKLATFKITDSNIHNISSIHTETSVHCVKYSDNLVIAGEANGSISYIDTRNDETVLHHVLSHESCIKVLEVEGNDICAGFLDGEILHIDKRTWKCIRKFSNGAFPISITCGNDTLVSILSDGTIHDYYQVENPQYNFEMPIISAINDLSDESTFHICDSKGYLRKFVKNKEVCTIEPSVAADEIQRLGHNTDMLVRNSNDEVYLIDGKTLQISERFGKVSFREKVKELSQRPSLYFPVTFNISTGVPRLIISNFLPKINGHSYNKTRDALKSMVLSLRENKIPVLATNSNGIPLWKSTSDKRLPFWMRYCVESHLIQEEKSD